ncbi:MAG: tetratricopeptide repeat protein [Jatrophihabitans sp.]|uniref:tetratricopeptide repeat protein n=1 Tax=Jatrophihabitans sp. TaxID=1932789 RepID=UPI003F7F9417
MRPGAPRRPARSGSPAQAAVPSAALAGAVDLAAVKARTEAAARAAEAPAPAAGDVVIDVTEATFQTAVLDRSFQVPVLLDLWADWCQPCKQLSPVLEKLAREGAGAWVLAKIDVDANPRISQALQVQSIPTVFAVIGGQLVPGFQGALPEAQLREFVQAVLQAGQEAGLSGGGAAAPAADGAEAEPAAPEDPRFTAAEAALDAGDYDAAIQQYQSILAVEPANTEAQLALGQVRLMQRIERTEPTAVQQADAAPDDVDLQLAAADLLLAGNRVEDALNRLLAAIRRTSGDDRDKARERLVEFFELLGPDDPRVAAARRELTRALF